MAHTQDFVPSRDAEFDGWLANLTGYVDGKTAGASPAWSHIPAANGLETAQHGLARRLRQDAGAAHIR
jgi:hypothetical protein